MLQYVEINPIGKAEASVIWLHGLGADGNDFADIVPQLNLPENLRVRFIFPHAPERNIDWARGAKMRAWFNVNEDFNTEDEDGIRSAPSLIEPFILAELAKGIPSQKIILAGFSQGGAVALQCGLRFHLPLGGIISLSAWLPLVKSVDKERNPVNQSMPILLQHGTFDDLIPLDWAKNAYSILKELNYNVVFNTYPMRHTVCDEEIAAIGQWLVTIV